MPFDASTGVRQQGCNEQQLIIMSHLLAQLRTLWMHGIVSRPPEGELRTDAERLVRRHESMPLCLCMSGTVAVVLRARPLRGGQPYVLLLQHNGVNSYSAAVQVRMCLCCSPNTV